MKRDAVLPINVQRPGLRKSTRRSADDGFDELKRHIHESNMAVEFTRRCAQPGRLAATFAAGSTTARLPPSLFQRRRPATSTASSSAVRAGSALRLARAAAGGGFTARPPSQNTPRMATPRMRQQRAGLSTAPAAARRDTAISQLHAEHDLLPRAAMAGAELVSDSSDDDALFDMADGSWPTSRGATAPHGSHRAASARPSTSPAVPGSGITPQSIAVESAHDAQSRVNALLQRYGAAESFPVYAPPEVRDSGVVFTAYTLPGMPRHKAPAVVITKRKARGNSPETDTPGRSNSCATGGSAPDSPSSLGDARSSGPQQHDTHAAAASTHAAQVHYDMAVTGEPCAPISLLRPRTARALPDGSVCAPLQHPHIQLVGEGSAAPTDLPSARGAGVAGAADNQHGKSDASHPAVPPLALHLLHRRPATAPHLESAPSKRARAATAALAHHSTAGGALSSTRETLGTTSPRAARSRTGLVAGTSVGVQARAATQQLLDAAHTDERAVDEIAHEMALNTARRGAQIASAKAAFQFVSEAESRELTRRLDQLAFSLPYRFKAKFDAVDTAVDAGGLSALQLLQLEATAAELRMKHRGLAQVRAVAAAVSYGKTELTGCDRVFVNLLARSVAAGVPLTRATVWAFLSQLHTDLKDSVLTAKLGGDPAQAADHWHHAAAASLLELERRQRLGIPMRTSKRAKRGGRALQTGASPAGGSSAAATSASAESESDSDDDAMLRAVEVPLPAVSTTQSAAQVVLPRSAAAALFPEEAEAASSPRGPGGAASLRDSVSAPVSLHGANAKATASKWTRTRLVHSHEPPSAEVLSAGVEEQEVDIWPWVLYGPLSALLAVMGIPWGYFVEWATERKLYVPLVPLKPVAEQAWHAVHRGGSADE